MNTIKLDGPLAAMREAEIRLLTDVADTLTNMAGNAQEDRNRLLDVAQDLRDLFFLVAVIGEFNAGKSSLINALLGDTLLPVGITPTTEMIELIRYDDQVSRQPRLREDGIREWTHPGVGAPGVAIVDTPGTGSIFQKHESTAKAFLHRSDLVVFVISAKRAFAETERMYLELARNYGKKIILVVNQVDLLEPAERDEVRRFVERKINELLDLEPLVFLVSAREGLASGSGGVEGLRAHLRGLYSEAPPAKQKLLAQLDMAERVIQRYQAVVQGNADLVSADTAKVREVQQEMEQQSIGLDAQLVAARASVDQVFEGIRQRGIAFIDTNLSVRKVGRKPRREVLQAEFQDQVIGRALREINEASGDYINAVVDQSRLYWRSIIERLNQLQDLMEQELSGMDAGVYAEQRESLQEAIQIAESELKSYSTGRVVSDIQAVFEANMDGFTTSTIAAFSGLIVALLALAVPGALSAPALVLSAPVTLIGGYAAFRYYRRITVETRRDFHQRVDQLEKAYHDALSDLTRKERNRLVQYGNQVLTPVFSRLEVLAQRYAEQQQALDDHRAAIKTLYKGIQES